MRVVGPLMLVCSLTLVMAVETAATAELLVTVPNPLRQDWPGELVSWDVAADVLPPGSLQACIVAVQEPVKKRRDEDGPDRAWRQLGEPGPARPVQRQMLPDGSERLWWIASVRGELKDPTKDKRGKPPYAVRVAISPATAVPEAAGLTIRGDEAGWTIDNGVGSSRWRAGATFDEALPLAELPHWLAGLRPAGSPAWDGSGHFQGDSRVTRVEAELVAAGPVFADIHYRYHFIDDQADGTVDRIPPALGKQTFRWRQPGPPQERVPRRSHTYELRLRVVQGSPLIEVNECFHLPADHGYRLAFGLPAATRPATVGELPEPFGFDCDTVTWVPWFEYDSFGGNAHQRFLPAVPREAQQGRPFAKLIARWHQRGGGAQDFLLTRGGAPPHKKAPGGEGFAPDLPAWGVVACFPSKWVGFRRVALHAWVAPERRGVDATLQAPGHGGWYGQRSYALCFGQRQDFHWLNGLVRRQSDWTLQALLNRYQLEWERDPAQAGVAILANDERLAVLRRALEPAAEGPDAAIIREYLAGDDKDQESDHLLQVLRGEHIDHVSWPRPARYLVTRYQDDSTNPTNYGNRRMVNAPFPMADLLTWDRPFGGPEQAAIGYIYSDLDAWPGWHNGWVPGPPNFHTDKYLATAFAAAAMRDHPHAADWAAFARANFKGDIARVITAPHGVGYECPGYSGYSLRLQLEAARALMNSGHGNPVVEEPLFKKTVDWHRRLLTPPDVRIGSRHEAPHGDTHRWHSGLGVGYTELAPFYRDADPAYAAQLMGVWQWLRNNGYPDRSGGGLIEHLLLRDATIPASSVAELDWSSRYYKHFGAIMRNNFDSVRESFCSIKAGAARGHYHNDEMTFHFYADATPISLDYNTSYSPRADHACLHNAVTFGREGTVRHNGRQEPVRAMEQLYDTAYLASFASADAADVVVAERGGGHLVLSPVDPHDSEFSRRYPARDAGALVHRRTLALIKHAPTSAFSDYVLVDDQTAGKEAAQVHLHLFGRRAAIDGGRILVPGQFDHDILVAVVGTPPEAITSEAYWYLASKYAAGPGAPYQLRPDEDIDAWQTRLQAVADEAGVDRLPLPDWQPWVGKRKEQAPGRDAWLELVRSTEGRALQVPPLWRGRWGAGEYQVWLRFALPPGGGLRYLIIPYRRGTPPPTVAEEADGWVSVSIGDEQERLHLDGATLQVDRAGSISALNAAVELPPLGSIERDLVAD